MSFKLTHPRNTGGNRTPAVNADKISATYKDGVLTVTVPKAEEVKPRQISIN